VIKETKSSLVVLVLLKPFNLCIYILTKHCIIFNVRSIGERIRTLKPSNIEFIAIVVKTKNVIAKIVISNAQIEGLFLYNHGRKINKLFLPPITVRISINNNILVMSPK
jgi:hypothetical protein